MNVIEFKSSISDCEVLRISVNRINLKNKNTKDVKNTATCTSTRYTFNNILKCQQNEWHTFLNKILTIFYLVNIVGRSDKIGPKKKNVNKMYHF